VHGLRRTSGLRREELATLAGISNDYYIRLERGKETSPSPEVIDALARALRMEPDEHEHLRSLAALAARRVSEAPPAPSRAASHGVRILLDSLRPNPAHVVRPQQRPPSVESRRPSLVRRPADWPLPQRNVWRYTFLHPTRRSLFDDSESQLRNCVTHLRALSGLEPDAPDLAAIVGELAVKSPEFAGLWRRYDVHGHPEDTKPSTTPKSAT
jgi:transcriptional regulator with XRE-family HTH domain